MHNRDELANEITAINHEFVRLLTHPSLQGASGAMGLNGEILETLWQLTPAELDELAALPLLLPEFYPFPTFGGVRDMERPLPAPVISKSWCAEKRDFANRLLTFVWQNARQDQWRTSLYAGINADNCRALAEMSFSGLSRCTEQASELLSVKLSGHPRFWPELLRALRHGSSNQQLASRLALIPLSIGQRWSGRNPKAKPAYL